MRPTQHHPMTTLYGIKNCDSVKKARRWLDSHAVPFRFHDFRTDGLSYQLLDGWIDTVGWEALLNRRSTSWRQLDDETKSTINATSARKLMLDNPTLIKRPVLERDGNLIVGFNSGQYQQLIGGSE